MFSTLSERGAVKTLDALSLGANDYVTKPANVGSVSAGKLRIKEELIPKIKALCAKLRGKSEPAPVQISAQPPKVYDFFPSLLSKVEVLAIGVSTGGPNALAQMLPGLATYFPAPIVIVQHMPPLFTKMLAERLATVTGRPAHEGEAGAVLRPGEIWIAPGGFHMEVERGAGENRLRIQQEQPENSCRPAVDVLFRSVAKVYGSRALAVVLTGMGSDGKIGCQHIREAGGHVLAQDEASSVVWGMPGAVVEAKLADNVLPLDELALEINRRMRVDNHLPGALQPIQLTHQS
jgi:two-component system, chemotaxis family, protein-glutamate methylesterase/glutaminase